MLLMLKLFMCAFCAVCAGALFAREQVQYDTLLDTILEECDDSYADSDGDSDDDLKQIHDEAIDLKRQLAVIREKKNSEEIDDLIVSYNERLKRLKKDYARLMSKKNRNYSNDVIPNNDCKSDCPDGLNYYKKRRRMKDVQEAESGAIIEHDSGNTAMKRITIR